MVFISYDDLSRPDIDLPTQRQLNELQKRHGQVEFRQIKDGWCVRITTDYLGEPLPLAAIGVSLYAAANRLVRIVTFSDPA